MIRRLCLRTFSKRLKGKDLMMDYVKPKHVA